MDLLRTGPASNQLIEYPSRVIFAFLRKELLSWAIWKLDSMSDSYHCTGSVQTFTFWAFIFSCGRALLYITVCPTSYHIIQLLRFLREVEIFFKRLRKGWIVEHTFIDRFLQRYTCTLSFGLLFARWWFAGHCHVLFASCCFHSVEVIFQVNVLHQSMKYSTTFLKWLPI